MASSSTPADNAGNTAGDGGGNPRDPSGYLTSSTASTVVKVVGTGRADINGLLGIVVSYNIERERYLVHMPVSQSTMALKRENLQKGTMIETYRAQWQQIRNDPRVREKVNHYIIWCQQRVRPFRLSHVAAVVFTLWTLLWVFFGFTKTIMATSLVLLLIVIAGPDLFVQREPPMVVLRRFPSRARETLEQQMPILRGRLTDKMATVIVLLLIALCVQSLFFTGNTRNTKSKSKGSGIGDFVSSHFGGSTSSMSSSSASAVVLDVKEMEAMYQLGYQDATEGKERGHSFQPAIDRLVEEQRRLQQEQEQQKQQQPHTPSRNEGDSLYLDDNGDPLLFPPPPPPKNTSSALSKLFNFSSLGSIYYAYRLLRDKGTDSTTGLFSLGQLAANLQHHTEPWQLGVLLFSIYNIVRTVF